MVFVLYLLVRRGHTLARIAQSLAAFARSLRRSFFFDRIYHYKATGWNESRGIGDRPVAKLERLSDNSSSLSLANMPSSDLAFWLQQQRSGRKWSQAELGARIGVSQATISTWERGKFLPDDVQLDRLRVISRGRRITKWKPVRRPLSRGRGKPL